MKDLSKWEKIRQKGKWHFIFFRGVLGWGFVMYIFMTWFPILMNQQSINRFFVIWTAGLWLFFGFLWGLVTWHWCEKIYLKEKFPVSTT